jgi:hypothetical protein
MKHILSIIVTSALVFICTVNTFSQEISDEPLTPRISEYPLQISEKDEKEIMAKLPADLKADLLKVKELDQERYRELLVETSYRQYDVYLEFMEASEKERYETEIVVQQLELQTEALGIQYAHAKENQKSALISKLKNKLSELFEMKEKERALNVEILERELAQLKESLTIRKQNKNEIINRRLNELIGKGDYLDW